MIYFFIQNAQKLQKSEPLNSHKNLQSIATYERSVGDFKSDFLWFFRIFVTQSSNRNREKYIFL